MNRNDKKSGEDEIEVLQSHDTKPVLGKIRAFEFFLDKPIPYKVNDALPISYGNKVK